MSEDRRVWVLVHGMGEEGYAILRISDVEKFIEGEADKFMDDNGSYRYRECFIRSHGKAYHWDDVNSANWIEIQEWEL